jgi:hypothetical protein
MRNGTLEQISTKIRQHYNNDSTKYDLRWSDNNTFIVQINVNDEYIKANYDVLSNPTHEEKKQKIDANAYYVEYFETVSPVINKYIFTALLKQNEEPIEDITEDENYGKNDKIPNIVIPEPVSSNICEPILKEYWGVKFTYDEGQNEKSWALTLAPAVKSRYNNKVPNALPGLLIQAKTSFSKKELPGWYSIYQPMGVESVYVTMVGMFTGDGGYKFKEDGSYRGFATYDNGKFKGRENASGTIDPTTNPNYNVGNRFVSGVMDFSDNASVAKLQKDIGIENATLANFVNREGLFDRVGCDGECPPPYRPFFGDKGAITGSDGISRSIRYPEFDVANPGAPGTYTRQELHAYLDAYHEFDDFLRFSVVNGRELSVEVNMRKSLDALRPKDRDWMPNESTLRNATTGNVKFTGVVRSIDSNYAYSNRMWYTIVMEVTKLGLVDQLAGTADDNYKLFTQEELKGIIKEEEKEGNTITNTDCDRLLSQIYSQLEPTIDKINSNWFNDENIIEITNTGNKIEVEVLTDVIKKYKARNIGAIITVVLGIIFIAIAGVGLIGTSAISATGILSAIVITLTLSALFYIIVEVARSMGFLVPESIIKKIDKLTKDAEKKSANIPFKVERNGDIITITCN